jgi:hypothetical protein
MTTRNSSAVMQGAGGDAMLKSKAHLGVLTAAAIIVVSVAPAFAQTGKTRVVSDKFERDVAHRFARSAFAE